MRRWASCPGFDPSPLASPRLLWCFAPVLPSLLFTLSVFVTSFPRYVNFSDWCSTSLLLYCFSFLAVFLFLDLLTWVRFSFFFCRLFVWIPRLGFVHLNFRSLTPFAPVLAVIGPRSPVSVTNLNRKVLNWLFTRSFASFFFFFACQLISDGPLRFNRVWSFHLLCRNAHC